MNLAALAEKGAKGVKKAVIGRVDDDTDNFQFDFSKSGFLSSVDDSKSGKTTGATVRVTGDFPYKGDDGKTYTVNVDLTAWVKTTVTEGEKVS